jgi:hypothetical protein
MKIQTLIFIGIIALLAAYALGRFAERLATVQGEVGDLKMRVGKLEEYKMRGEMRWGWLRHVVSHVPVVKGLLT